MDTYKIIVIVVIIVTAIQILPRFVLKKNKELKNSIKNPNTIRQPKSYLFVGIGGVVFFVAVALYALLAPDSMIVQNEKMERIAVMIVMFCISIPYIFIILFQVNWKIEIEDKSFTFSNIFGRKRTFQFDEVKVKQLSRCTRFYHNDKHIVGLSYLQTNWDALQNAIQSYQKVQKKRQKI